MPNWSSLVAPQFAMANCGAANGDKIGIMTPLSIQWRCIRRLRCISSYLQTVSLQLALVSDGSASYGIRSYGEIGLVATTCHNMLLVGVSTWWRHQMETFSALLAICVGNSPVPGEFATQRPVTRSFDVYFDLRPNKRLSKQSWGWWFETLSHSLWRHRYDIELYVRSEARSVEARKAIHKLWRVLYAMSFWLYNDVIITSCVRCGNNNLLGTASSSIGYAFMLCHPYRHCFECVSLCVNVMLFGKIKYLTWLGSTPCDPWANCHMCN